jgi:chlorophyll(ide) b reductase
VRAAGRGGGAALTPPFNVVVTGATKGVGLALAQEFVRAGDSVAVCSRDAGRVAAAVAALSALAAEGGGAARVVGRAVNVARPAEVAAFADYAAAGARPPSRC